METALARSALYNFLAAAFGEPPTAALVDSARAIIPALADAPLDDLQREYTRLLVGPGAGYIPPYASIYLHPAEAGKALLWGAEAARVESTYRAAGLEIAPGQPRLPDHLALELQFMQHLCACQADAALRGDMQEAAEWQARQEAFLQGHLLVWLSRFAAQVEQSARLPFYPTLINFTLDFIQSEIENLKAVAAL
ncbi:MAG: hypothetical protein CO094_13630 [Anaerolineae bacterium CG_4_9_14_3_um_filter_57_17]|nr:molecular chaperone TorD family protein [bacterium]OIO85244.1 MAG: hypothetical protein AUK01_06590 [Anaerolineae bacterium CG2_30_57_67]PJB64253.1 MAG: hypothetical protein CO094_13630 [Anaerolineae bacterium CG_4_9_14_3_um_filter_57_17]